MKNLLTREENGWGKRTKLAKFIGCQSGFISQVLNGQTHFSLEHGPKINEFLGHSEEESHYFFLLLQEARAGTYVLKKYFQTQIKYIEEQRKKINQRIKVKSEISNEGKALYYSKWFYSAIHFIIAIPQYQTTEAISKRLKLPIRLVSKILQNLVDMKLIKQNGLEYKIIETRIHLDSESPFISKHHINWKVEAIKSLEKEEEKNFDYSSVIAISKEDASRMKEVLYQALENSESILRDSPEEEIYSLQMNFFKL